MNSKAIFLATGIILIAASANISVAETTTEPVAYTTIKLDEGYNSVSVSLLHPAVFAGSVQSVSTNPNSTIVASGSGLAIGALLDATKKYYLETTGPLSPSTNPPVGHRFEVDVTATKVSNSATITLEAASPTNTTAALPDLTGLNFVIRPHVNLADVFGGAGRPILNGSATADAADQVQFLSRTHEWLLIAYWFHSDANVTEWRSVDDPNDLTDYSTLPIAPGSGVVVYRKPGTGPVDIVHTGDVRTTPFRLPLPAGYFLASNPAPLDSSPIQRKMNRANGFTGAGIFTSADQVLFLQNDTLWKHYYLRSNASGSIQQWRDLTSSNPHDYMFDSGFFNADEAVFFSMRSPLSDYWMQLP